MKVGTRGGKVIAGSEWQTRITTWRACKLSFVHVPIRLILDELKMK